MKKDQIPQDESSLAKSKIKELCYVTDENGEYTTGLSQGWKPKSEALEGSLMAIEERVLELEKLVQLGKISPIELLMEKNRMDLPTAAAYTGFFSWQIKRHFNLKRFNKLSERKKLKYCEAFNISLEQLNSYTV